MQFDDFYKTIEVFGRYQKVKYLLICLTYMFPPIMVYSWSFTAATPTFHCRTTSVDDMPEISIINYIPTESQCRQYQSGISVSECQRCFQITNKTDENNGPMKPCTSFIFDRTYYQSTLVEEVDRKNFIDMKSKISYMFSF